MYDITSQNQFAFQYVQKIHQILFCPPQLDESPQKYTISHIQDHLAYFSSIFARRRYLTVGIQERALCHILVSLSPHSRNLCALISRDAWGQASSCRYRNSAIFGDARKQRWNLHCEFHSRFVQRKISYKTNASRVTHLDLKGKESK